MKALAMVAGCMALALMASGVYAQGAPKTGTVTAVDVEKKTVTVDLSPMRPLTFDVNADTKITQGDAVKTLADVKVGARVEVTYSKTGDEKRLASAIKILAAPAGGPTGEAPKERQK